MSADEYGYTAGEITARRAESLEWAGRMRRFMDTWDYGLITQGDLDRLHAHLSTSLRIWAMTEEEADPHSP